MPPPTTTARRPKRLLMIRSTNFGTGRSSCANCSRVSVAEKIATTVMCGPHGVTDFRIGLTVPSEPLAQAFIDHEAARDLELAQGARHEARLPGGDVRYETDEFHPPPPAAPAPDRCRPHQSAEPRPLS